MLKFSLRNKKKFHGPMSDENEDTALTQSCVSLKTADLKISRICTDPSRYHHFIVVVAYLC